MGNTSLRESKMERLRLKMYRSYQENKDNEEVVLISQELDKLINEFIALPENNSINNGN